MKRFFNSKEQAKRDVKAKRLKRQRERAKLEKELLPQAQRLADISLITKSLMVQVDMQLKKPKPLEEKKPEFFDVSKLKFKPRTPKEEFMSLDDIDKALKAHKNKLKGGE